MAHEYKVEDVKDEEGTTSLEVQLNIRAREGWIFKGFYEDQKYVIFEREEVQEA